MNLKYLLIGLFASVIIGCGCAAAIPFSGEIVQVTGNQTGDIVWNGSNFGGFCYNLSGDACTGTETLTIGAGALEGPDIDRFIDVGNLTYTTSPIWQEYELHKNLGLTVESDHHEGDSGYWVEFWEGKRYVAIDKRAYKLTKPLVEFDYTDIKTLTAGEEWDVGGGFTLNAMQIDLEGEKVWFCLYKNGKEIDNEVINAGDPNLQDRVYTCTEDVESADDVPIFSCYVSAVFRGTCSNVVQIEYVFLIDDDVTRFHTGNEYGSMKVATASSSGIVLKNNATINLTPNTTAPVMGNLSFKATDNTSTIEFYPHLIRDELPMLSGGGGFVLDDCWIDQPWNLFEGYSIAAKDVSFKGNKARITLLKNGVVVDERILTEEQRAPVDSDCRYSYVQNGTEIINASLKVVFRGNDSNVVELAEVCQRSEVDGSILINNESHLFKSADPAGIPWGIADGYVLTVEDIGLDGDEVWLELSKNGTVVKETILNDNFANASTFTCNTSDNGSINCVVDTVFRGSKAGAVKLVNLSQYSDADGTALPTHESYLYKTSDPEGIPWELVDGYMLTVKDVEEVTRNYWYYQYPGKGDAVWLELFGDGDVLKEDILESGDLFKYSNGLESVDCIVDKVFNGGLADVVKLTNVNQYSNDGTRLIENGTKTYTTLDPTDGDIWECWEGYSLALKDVNLDEDQAWLSLSKNGEVVEDAIIDEDSWFKHHNSTGTLVFSTCVDTVFRGVETCSVQLMHTMQYSEIDGKPVIEPSADSWQLQEGYYLTAQDIYRNDSVWLQLSKNDKLVDEGLFYNNSSFSLQNDTADQTVVFGMVCSDYWDDEYVQLTSITQYHETNGTALATWQSKTLYASRSFNDKKELTVPLRFPTTLTVDDSGGADFNSIETAVDASIPGDTIYVRAGTYVEKVHVYKRLTLEGEGADVVTVTAESASGSVFRVDSDHVNISGFTVTGATDPSGSGIYLSGVDYCNISGNNVSNNFYGICIKHSSDNTLTDNTMSENRYNFGIFGDNLSHYIQNIDTSNTVDEKPIYYWVGRKNAQIPGDAGFVGVVNSTNITVMDMVLANNMQGVLFAYAENSRIENVSTSENEYGIYLSSSSDNTVANNNALNNCYGIYLLSSSDNALLNNDAAHNWRGIYLDFSSGNLLTNNIATSNDYHGIYLNSSNNNTLTGNAANFNYYYFFGSFRGDGITLSHSSNNTLASNTANSNGECNIQLRHSSNNTLYHNNLITNNKWCNVCDWDGANQWDNGAEGNYYSNYRGTDSNGDGISDQPYYIPCRCYSCKSYSIDRYPLMQPWTSPPQKGDLDRDGVITPADAAIALQLAACRECAAGASADLRSTSQAAGITSVPITQITQTSALEMSVTDGACKVVLDARYGDAEAQEAVVTLTLTNTGSGRVNVYQPTLPSPGEGITLTALGIYPITIPCNESVDVLINVRVTGDVAEGTYIRTAHFGDSAATITINVRRLTRYSLDCEIADVSGDGQVTSLDALMILQMAAKDPGAVSAIVIKELMPNPTGIDRGNETL
ncbi:MAG: hypothetical protein C4B59_10225 [Candidatus Methanogaster sp.]|uniref:Uncharacterized protein n=1 Tax=Candidatus Methanogaster sp. TaxID=3386292 RepID=A0AC61L1S9_9EURY|nr:MAG: hypothetical protein C4B59_10225 [ANME-2 cluster archaeon]